MKKNTKTYVLLAVVALIWGTIAYKILFSLSADPVEITTTETATIQPIAKKEKDTFSIRADYRDPFLGTLPKKVVKKRKPNPKPTKKPEPEIQVQYTGLVTDKETRERIFFVSINGQQYVMSANDEIQKVKLLGGNASSIRIHHNNKTRTIKLQD